MRSPPFLFVTAVFAISLLSYFNSADQSYFLDRMRIKLPFLILPFAYFAMPGFSKELFFKILYFFFVLVSIMSTIILVIYLLDPEYYNKLYGAGQVVPTPIQHIRYSLLVNVAICAGIYMLFNTYTWQFKYEKYLQLACVLFMLIFLHVLAVRSGLVAIYAILVFTAIFYLIKKREFIKGLFLLILIPVLGFIGVNYVPTIKSKIGYTKYSLEQMRKKRNIRDLSDSRRIGSILAGYDIGKKNPAFGIGLGDIKSETNVYLKEHFPDIQDLDLLPHNQYVFYFAAMGLVGLILFLICTLIPTFYYNAYTDYFFLSLQIIYITSFLVEHTIESQLGTATFILFFLLSLRYLKLKSTSNA